MPQEQTADQKKQTDSEAFSHTLGNLLGLGTQAAPSQGGVVSPQQMGSVPNVTTPPQGPGMGFDPRGASQPPVSAMPPAPTGGPPQSPNYRSGFEFNTLAGRNAAVATNTLQGISEAIFGIKKKKAEDNIAKAKNTMDMFNQARAQGDEATANLLATDPKIVQQWEKYLKMEFERVPGQPPKGKEPPPGRMPEYNTPGGISVPRAGPQQNLQAAVQNMLKQGIESGDPRAMAAVMGPGYVLSPDEFKKSVRAQYGFELTPNQLTQIDVQNKQLMAQAFADYTKFVTGKTMDEATRKEVAQIIVTGGKEKENIYVKGLKDVATIRANAIKDVQKAKGSDANLKIVLGQMNMYKGMAVASTNMMAKIEHDKPGDYQKDPSYLYFQQQAQDAQAKADGTKEQYDNMKILDEVMRDDDDTTPPDTE